MLHSPAPLIHQPPSKRTNPLVKRNSSMKNAVNFTAQQLLGSELKRVREEQEMPCKKLARIVNVTDTQIRKFEAGAFVPMAMLEALAEALGEPIPKRIIRRISNLRKMEIEDHEPQDELKQIYTTLFDTAADRASDE